MSDVEVMIDENITTLTETELRFEGKTLIDVLRETDCSDRLADITSKLEKSEKDNLTRVDELRKSFGASVETGN
jgi:hypothetical protein